VDINLKGSRNFAAAVLPHMASGSRLVLLASLAGLVGNYAYAAYNASKFGVVGLASALRIEYKPAASPSRSSARLKSRRRWSSRSASTRRRWP